LKRVETVKVSVTTPSTNGSPFDWTQRVTQTIVNTRTTTETFDRATRTATTVSPMGRSSSQVLDTLGRPVGATAPGRDPVVIAYDAAGRLQTVTQGVGPSARSTQYGYDTNTGFLASVTAPVLNEVTTYARDSVGRAKRITRPDAQITEMEYDEVGNLVAFTPPALSAHAMAYTTADLLNDYRAPAAVVGGVAPVTHVDYTKHRRPKLLTRADGKSIQSTYRTDGKLATVISPRGVSTVSYHATTGLPSGISDVDGGNVALTYDGALPLSTTWSGAGRPAGTVARTYDSNFWLDLLRVNGTIIADYSYDNDGLITGTGALSVMRNVQTGDITSTTLDAVTTTEATNSFGELDTFSSTQGTTPLFREQITTRDVRGRIVERVETILGAAKSYGYSYDQAGRLIDVRVDGLQSAHYDYDANGNRVARTTNATTQSGTYDAQDRLTSYAGVTYTYGAAGELATKSAVASNTSYDYDVFGNLRGVVLPDGRTITYEIDAGQRRIGKRINGVRQYGLLYQSQLAPVAQLDANNAVVATFVFGTRANVPDYMIKSGQRYRIVSDHLGSVRMVIRSADGVVLQRLDYDEFGNVLVDSNPGFQPFGFAGGLYDADTGLVRFGARDYDAVTGRWTAKDPLLFSGGDTNLYAYVGSEPVNRIDPDGTWSVTFSFFAVRGGSVTFGDSSDGWFLRGKAGLGLGGGLSFDPDGKLPHGDGMAGICADVGARVGPLKAGWGWSGGAYRSNNGEGGFYQGDGATGSFAGKGFGFSVGFMVGGEAGFTF
jgi:RHS repeat-associated protein